MAALVGDVEETARTGSKAEEARHAALGRHPLARRERALGRIDAEHADAVVAAVGDVDVAAGAIDRDLGAGAVAGEFRRRRVYDLQRRQLAAGAVLAIGRDRRIELVDHVGERAPRMEIDMARAGAGPGGDFVGVDGEAALGIEAIGDDAVGALGRQVEEAALAIERIVVRPHVLLLGAVRPQRALDRRQGRVGAERAVRLHGKHRDRVGAVVGDEQELAGRVEGEMDRIVAAGRLAADHAQMAGLAHRSRRR